MGKTREISSDFLYIFYGEDGLPEIIGSLEEIAAYAGVDKHSVNNSIWKSVKFGYDSKYAKIRLEDISDE